MGACRPRGSPGLLPPEICVKAVFWKVTHKAANRWHVTSWERMCYTECLQFIYSHDLQAS